MESSKLVYKRILLKLSGEALQGQGAFGIDSVAASEIAMAIKTLTQMGVEVGIVLGGGNLLRGATLAQSGFDRVTCDHAGMMATVINGLMVRDALLNVGLTAHLLSSLAIQGTVETYDRSKAVYYLNQGRVVVFAGGTGNPFFSTDSAASLRAIEIGADVLLKATKVDGVYSADPMIDKDAEFFKTLSYDEVIKRQLKVMDMTAFSLCRDHAMPIRVFNMYQPGILKEIILGADLGTLVN